jgi:hypothetical protein
MLGLFYFFCSKKKSKTTDQITFGTLWQIRNKFGMEILVGNIRSSAINAAPC